MATEPERPFDPGICDLCESRATDVLFGLGTGRAMRSDRMLVARDLRKLVCRYCGLVRSGDPLTSSDLADLYGVQYTLSTEWEDHIFYTSRGPVPRSVAVADWMIHSMGEYRWRAARRVLEVGAGAGALVRELARRFTAATFEGLELNQSAAARAGDLRIHTRSLSELDDGEYDLIYAVAVIEHVASPSRFLRDIRARLGPGGLLYLCQPVQDVPSYDVLFIDHLHHFGVAHLRQYAAKCGFRELGFVVGHELMPNFAVHLWQKAPETGGWSWQGPAAYTCCADSARSVLSDMAHLDTTLATLAASGRRTAVLGLNEVYWLARAYSALGDFPIVCGLDDRPNQPQYARLGFPVVRPEASLSYGVQDVILATNAVYYPILRSRLEGLGLSVHALFTERAR